MTASEQNDLFGDTPRRDPRGDYKVVTEADRAARAAGFKNPVQMRRTLERLLEGERIGVFPPPPKDSKRVPLFPSWPDAPPYGWPKVSRPWLREQFDSKHLAVADTWPNGQKLLTLTEAGKVWAEAQLATLPVGEGE